MNLFFSPKITEFARALPAPLYAVGGYVRNFFIDGTLSEDVDLASPLTVDELLPFLDEYGIEIVALYKRTGTVVFRADGLKYEFTTFRKDEYSDGGTHSPERTLYTSDIFEDARRRDFKCNAVYYDIARGEVVDPLNGLEDVKNKVLDTVVSPQAVFSHDGLRLMRLARFTGELGFTPTAEVICSARENAENITFISAERIYAELKSILVADEKYPFSDKLGHYTALKVLADTRVLDYIFPELGAGRGMRQRADFHNYDVLEHSLRACMYAPKGIRLAALLHDVGKPYCINEYGNYSDHATAGEELVEVALKRIKADNKTIKTVKFLTKSHMYDLHGDEDEREIRRFIVKNYEYVDELLLLKQADYSAHKDDLTTRKAVAKWRALLSKMSRDGTPIRLKDLAVNAKDLKKLGVKDADLGKILNGLWEKAVENPELNEKTRLLALLKTGT